MAREIRTCHRCLLAVLGLLLLIAATGMRLPAPLPKDEPARQVLITILSPLTMRAGNPVDVQVALINGNGQAVEDLPVMLYLGEQWRQEVESDGLGRAYFRLLDSLPAGDHLLIIKVKGKHGFRDSWIQSRLTVLGAPATATSEAKASAVANPALVVQLTAVSAVTVPPVQAITQPVLPAPMVAAPVAVVRVISTTPANETRPVVLPTAVSTVVRADAPALPVALPTVAQLPSPGFSLRDLGLGLFVGVLLTILLFMSNHFWQILAWIRLRVHTPTVSLPWHSTSNFHHLMIDHIRRAKWGLLCALASMVGSALMDLISPWPLKIIFDYILLDAPLPAALG